MWGTARGESPPRVAYPGEVQTGGSGRAERLARGFLVGAFAVGAAAVSHTLAGGYRPNALSLTIALVFAGMLGTVAIGRRPSLPRLAITTAGSQLGFHLLFSLLGGTDGGPAASSSGAGAMHGMDMAPSVAPDASGVPVHDHLLDPGMWLAHLVAGLLTLWFLRRAERALWSMLRRLVLRLVLVVRPLGPVAPRPAPLPRVRAPRPGRHIAALPLRGPPSALSF
jgi:hypothetical protein